MDFHMPAIRPLHNGREERGARGPEAPDERIRDVYLHQVLIPLGDNDLGPR
jgi:hypothetical protein